MNKIFSQNPILGREGGSAAVRGSEIPYIPQPKRARFDVRENGRALLVGGGLVLTLLLLALSGIFRRQQISQAQHKNGFVTTASRNGKSEMSLTPILDIGPNTHEGATSPDTTSADQILRTASEKPSPNPPTTLANIPPIEDSSWQPPPYSGQFRSESPTTQDKSREPEEGSVPRPVVLDSLVFVAKPNPLSEGKSAQPSRSQNLLFRITAGTRLRARIESEINSAVKSPVVAIIEDNYEQDGLVIIPAGSRAIGRLVNADKSGYLEVRFNSLDLPFGPSLQVAAIASDLQLRPLRGRVQGKGTGKNLLIRSAAGLGEVAATLVGRGSLNQPLSEEDMLRERLSNNIGQTGDQHLAAMALSQRFVVSLNAGAEIYLIVEEGSNETINLDDSQSGAADKHLDELRQLRPPQRELTPSSAAQ